MMKKLMSVFICALMLCSVIPANAVENSNTPLYKDKFMEAFGGEPNYEELYYHVQDQTIDWVLVYGPSEWGGSVVVTAKVCDRSIVSPVEHFTFATGYGIYDVAQDQFFDIAYLKEKGYEYEGLAEALAELKIGSKIGDINMDDVVDVKDVTKLQRFLAEFKTELHVDTNLDTNYDGSININDATHIQRIIAGLV